MKKIILTSITTSLILIFITVLLLNCIYHKKQESEYCFIGGTIRNVGDGWFLLDNDGHETLNIIKVETTDKNIIIYYTEYNKVISFSVTPDETMAGEGYTFGASVGLDNAVINVYDKDHNLINPNDYINGGGNIWINGMFKS